MASTVSALTEWVGETKTAQLKAKESTVELKNNHTSVQVGGEPNRNPLEDGSQRVLGPLIQAGSTKKRGHKSEKSLKKAPKPTPQATVAAHVAIMQILVSVVALAAGIYFIITGKPNVQVVAAGWIGIVIGYWLR